MKRPTLQGVRQADQDKFVPNDKVRKIFAKFGVVIICDLKQPGDQSNDLPIDRVLSRVLS